MIRHFSLACCLILWAAGCDSRVDIEEERKVLLETDLAWAGAAAAGDMEKVFSYWSDEATIIPAGMEAVRGKEAIRSFVATNRAQRNFSLRAEPLKATVSSAGDLGYTVGNYEISMDGPNGTPIVSRGRYLATWRKDGTGAWKCTTEIHSPLSAATGSELQQDQQAGAIARDPEE